MPHIETLVGFHLTCLPAEPRPNNAGPYYYLVTRQSMAHTAFRTRAALVRWMELRGLTAPKDIPESASIPRDKVVMMPIHGMYRRASLYDQEEFRALKGIETRELNNARYTRAVVTERDGIRTVNFLNCNVQDREEFDYQESRALEDRGEL